MKYRPEYSPPLACSWCGALAERLGRTDTDPMDGSRKFVPVGLEHPVQSDTRHAEQRVGPSSVTYDKAGRENVKPGQVYFVVEYSHICTRHKTAEDPRPECGVLPAFAVSKPYEGDLPAWIDFPEAGHELTRAEIRAMAAQVFASMS